MSQEKDVEREVEGEVTETVFEGHSAVVEVSEAIGRDEVEVAIK
jgi:hypothetical protein